MARKPRAYSRAKRKEQILNQFRVWIENGDTEPKTMNRVARALDMIPAQTVTNMLLELELEGYLTCEMRDQSGRWTTRFYYPVIPRLIMEKYSRRHITLRKRGVAVGQLEMFS